MYNYEHEIPFPDDRAMQKFLWNDYFHDSDILSVEFSDFRRNEIILRLRCARDTDQMWEKLRGDWDERHAWIEAHAARFTYLLKFSQVEYFDCQRFGASPCDYINARFKDSALLRRLQKERGRKLYHLRVQTGSGLIDIVFAGFSIRKQEGRVSYGEILPDAGRMSTSGARILPSESQPPDDAPPFVDVKAIFEDAEDDGLLDFRRCCELERRYQAGDRGMLPDLRFHLREDQGITDTKLCSAYLLGKLGDASDIPALQELYFSVDAAIRTHSWARSTTALPKRNIMDAIELIRLRAEGSETSV